MYGWVNAARLVPTRNRDGRCLWAGCLNGGPFDSWLTPAEGIGAEGGRAVAVVYDLGNRRYTESLYRFFKEELEENGGSVPLAMTIGDDQSPRLAEVAEKIVAAGVDGVFICASAIDSAAAAQQLWKAGSKATLYGVSWAATNDLVQQGGAAVEGCIWWSIGSGPRS